VQRLADQPAGVLAADDLGDRAQRAGQPEPAGDDRGQLDRGGGDQPDPLAGVEVQLGQRLGAGPDPLGHQLVVDLLAQPDDLVHVLAGHERQCGLPGREHPLGRFLAADPELHLLPGEVEDVPGRDEVAGGQPAGEVVDRRPGDDRVVDVEERTGGRVGRHLEGALDLRRGGRRGAGQHGAGVPGVPGPEPQPRHG
jgi:hypothetical protein